MAGGLFASSLSFLSAAFSRGAACHSGNWENLNISSRRRSNSPTERSITTWATGMASTRSRGTPRSTSQALEPV